MSIATASPPTTGKREMEQASSNLHPVFQSALAAFGPSGQSQIAAAKRAAYVKALKAHDWSHEFSDDHAAYERGRESLAQLKLAQREVDPSWELWNEHAPERCRNGRSYA